MRKALLVSILIFIWLISSFIFAQENDSIKITREKWGEMVGFEPNLSLAGYEPGLTIDSANADKFKSAIPDAVMTLIRKYGMSLETRAYMPYAPSNGYINATNKYRGKTKLLDIGDATDEREIDGYQGGMPFPKPKNGREIAWNFVLGYGGDDSETIFEVFWISRRRGIERTETWKTTSIHRAKYRTDVPPIPSVPFLVDKGVIAATLTQALAPADKRGFASLYYGYLEPKEPNGWLYLPAQRRSIRLAFGLKGEAWNNTDLLYEDVRGYTGSPEWMNWKLVQKTTMFCAIHSGVTPGKGNSNEAFDFENAPHWNPKMKWELRPVYIVEATPKIKGYPYSKMIFTIDAESSHIFTKTAYDRKGQLWKVLIHAGIGSKIPAKNPGSPALALVVDLQSEHATAFFWHMSKSNVSPNPKFFSQTTLRKLGK